MLKRSLVAAFITTLALFIGASVVAQAGNKELLQSFLDTLNTKDRAKVQAFVEKKFDAGIPIGARMERLMGLVAQGAPFKLIRLGTQTSAEIEDRNGERLVLRIDVGNDGKIGRIMVGGPEELDAKPPKDYTGWTSLSSLAQSVALDTDSPAIGIAVLRKGRLETAYAGVRKVGSANKVGPGDAWSVGSIGKPICSTLIGRLIELGKLDWSTTIFQALPEIPMNEGYRAVTLEQLMQHRGGIAQDMGMLRDQVQRIVAGETDPRRIRQNYAKDILSRDPIGKPGEKFAYSNAGYALLGVIAERAMDKAYESLVGEYIFGPLELKRSYLGGAGLPKERPWGHVLEGGELQPENMSGPIEVLYAPAGGGTYMSLEDLATFGQAHLNGLQGRDGLLKASTVKRLHQGLAEGPGGELLYGCGWGIESFRGLEPMHAHNGSNGTMRAQLSIFPKAGLTVASIVNRGGESEPSPPLQAVLAIARRYASAEGNSTGLESGPIQVTFTHAICR